MDVDAAYQPGVMGAALCIPAGYSFDALRLSTLTLSLLGIIGAYLLMRELRRSRLVAVAVALTFGFNPVYFALSNTFMTDVPFTATFILASLFFLRSLRGDSDFDWLLGMVLAIAATLCRQLGVALPLAFAISLLLRRGVAFRYAMRAVFPPIACIGALFGLQHWLAATGRLPALYGSSTETLLIAVTHLKWFVTHPLINTIQCLLYLGWFLSPLLLFGFVNMWRLSENRKILGHALFGAGAILLAYLVVLCPQHMMPVQDNIGNVVTASGIGPITVRHADDPHDQMPAVPHFGWRSLPSVWWADHFWDLPWARLRSTWAAAVARSDER